jgi:hypothetical protein
MIEKSPGSLPAKLNLLRTNTHNTHTHSHHTHKNTHIIKNAFDLKVVEGVVHTEGRFNQR